MLILETLVVIPQDIKLLLIAITLPQFLPRLLQLFEHLSLVVFPFEDVFLKLFDFGVVCLFLLLELFFEVSNNL